MIKKPLALVLALLCMPCVAMASGVKLSIEGLKGKVEENVNVYLSSIPQKEYDTSLRFQARLERNITEALNALGYYHPQFDFHVSDKGDKLTVKVTPGTPTLIKQLDIEFAGEAKQDPDFADLVKNSGLKIGKRLNHGAYDSLKSGIRNLALQKGYFDGDFTLNRLEVSPELNQAYIKLHYDSGIRYHFGDTMITGSQIEEDRVHSLEPYKKGEPYLVTQVVSTTKTFLIPIGSRRYLLSLI